MKTAEPSQCKEARRCIAELFDSRVLHEDAKNAKESAMRHMVDDSSGQRKIRCWPCWDLYREAERRYHATT